MLTRSSILGLATVATVAAAAFSPTGASAKPMGVIIKKPPVMGVVLPPSKPVMGVIIHPPGLVVNPPHPILGVVIHPPITGVVIHHPDHDDDDHHFWWHHYHRPWMVEQTVPMQVSTPVATTPVTTTPTAPCTCLTKNYLTDGSVLFKDVCTKETAVATPDELKAQMQGARP